MVVVYWDYSVSVELEKQLSQLTTITDLANILPHISRCHFWQAIERLNLRSLIQEKAGKYTLQPVVMEYVMEQFKPKPV